MGGEVGPADRNPVAQREPVGGDHDLAHFDGPLACPVLAGHHQHRRARGDAQDGSFHGQAAPDRDVLGQLVDRDADGLQPLQHPPPGEGALLGGRDDGPGGDLGRLVARRQLDRAAAGGEQVPGPVHQGARSQPQPACHRPRRAHALRLVLPGHGRPLSGQAEW